MPFLVLDGSWVKIYVVFRWNENNEAVDGLCWWSLNLKVLCKKGVQGCGWCLDMEELVCNRVKWVVQNSSSRTSKHLFLVALYLKVQKCTHAMAGSVFGLLQPFLAEMAVWQITFTCAVSYLAHFLVREHGKKWCLSPDWKIDEEVWYT